MKERHLKFLLLFGVVILILSGCIPGDGSHTNDDPAGFFWGIWHGWMAPISLIMGIFRDNIRVYEVFNTGWWYDFGFYMAIIGGFGGISLSRSKDSKKSKRDRRDR